MRIVSFECLPGLLKDTVTRHACGQAVKSFAPPHAVTAASEKDAFAVGVLRLLEQLRAIAQQSRAALDPAGAVDDPAAAADRVLFTASWLDKVPTDPGKQALYRALLEAVCARLGIPRTGGRHHAVCIHTDLHETFEELLELGADYKNVSIADLHALQQRMMGGDVTETVFPVTYHHVRAGKYAADCIEDTEHVIKQAMQVVEKTSQHAADKIKMSG